MANSRIFVVYTSADGGNVTVSGRKGVGHVMPMVDSDTDVALLEGSGVEGGIMTANVRCESYLFSSWHRLTALLSPFLYPRVRMKKGNDGTGLMGKDKMLT